MITCSVCGHLNDPSNAVCEECGSDLSDSEDWDMDYDDQGDIMATCPNCGEIVMEGDPYCSHCGTALRWIEDDSNSNDEIGRAHV